MNSTIRLANLWLLLGCWALCIQTVHAQTAPKLSLQMQNGYAGITVAGTLNAVH
jgi:hypothetical protein